MAINPHRKGGSGIPVPDGGTGSSNPSAALAALGGLNAASHALLDHTAVPGVSGLPAGTVVDFAGTVAPAGWLECDGASYTTASRVNLFAAIGYSWGGAGANFNVPDLRRRTTVGRGGAGSAVLGNVVGNTGGAEAHALSVGELAAHSHSDSGHTHNLAQTSPIALGTYGVDVMTDGPSYFMLTGSNAGNTVAVTGAVASASANISNNGSNAAHNNVQPSAVMMKIIKT